MQALKWKINMNFNVLVLWLGPPQQGSLAQGEGSAAELEPLRQPPLAALALAVRILGGAHMVAGLPHRHHVTESTRLLQVLVRVAGNDGGRLTGQAGTVPGYIETTHW